MKKRFLFLYPHEDIIEFEIQRGAVFYERLYDDNRKRFFEEKLKKSRNEREKRIIQREARKDLEYYFGEYYSNLLNRCINMRYRTKGFEINFALLDDLEISKRIDVRDSDKRLYVGVDFKSHRTKREEGNYVYPDEDFVLNNFENKDKIVISGFHLWDCVQRYAKRAYEKGMDVMVDEDLTELFVGRIFDEDFEIERYKYFGPKDKGLYEEFFEARKSKPWMLVE